MILLSPGDPAVHILTNFRSNYTFQENVLLPTESSNLKITLPSKSPSPTSMKKVELSQVPTPPTLYVVTSEVEVKPMTL